MRHLVGKRPPRARRGWSQHQWCMPQTPRLLPAEQRPFKFHGILSCVAMRPMLRSVLGRAVGSSQRLKAGVRGIAVASDANAQSIDEESLSRYCAGGYHPVRLGDTFKAGQYKVLRKLGYGLYSTVWLAHNKETNQHVALKILTADACDGENDTFELDMLRHIRTQSHGAGDAVGSSKVVGLIDEFSHTGPNGQHACLVFKPMGPDMSHIRSLFPYPRLPGPVAKKVSRDLLQSLAFLHDHCKIIHTDIKPQNILVETPELDDMFTNAPSDVLLQDCRPLDPPLDYYMASEPVVSAREDLAEAHGISVRLGDLGVASWFDRHLTEWIQPEKLRAPEVILGAPWDRKVDIWNLGLVLWELVQGQLCFDGQATAEADYSDEAHLAQMVSICGPFPTALIERSEHGHQYFDENGALRGDIHFPSMKLREIGASAGALSGQDEEHFVAFIQSMLALEPGERPEARELLNAAWIIGSA